MNLESVLEALQSYTVGNLNTFLTAMDDDIVLEKIDAGRVNLFDLDPDKYRYPVMITIAPDREEMDAAGFDGYAVRSELSVYLVLRNSADSELFRRTIRTATAYIQMLSADGTLGGEVGDVEVLDLDYYDAVGGDKSRKGAEIRLAVHYEI
jgi:hypothetical protein